MKNEGMMKALTALAESVDVLSKQLLVLAQMLNILIVTVQWHNELLLTAFKKINKLEEEECYP